MQLLNYDFILKADQEAIDALNINNFNQKNLLISYFIPQENIQSSSLDFRFQQLNKTPILIFHGGIEKYRLMKNRFKLYKIVILSHSQDKVYLEEENQIIIQTGNDLEYV
jgi:hypothetical protein